MKCEQCGSSNPSELEYCAVCGGNLVSDDTDARMEIEEKDVENISGTSAVSEKETDDTLLLEAEASDEIFAEHAENQDNEASEPSESKLKGANAKLLVGVIALLIIGTVGAFTLKNNIAAKAINPSKAAATTTASLTTDAKPQDAAKTVESSDAVVVTLGKEPIRLPVFRIYFWVTQQRFETAGPNVWSMTSGGKKTEDIAKENTLKDIKTAIAAKQKAEELGLKITDEEKKKIYDQANELMTGNVQLVGTLQFDIDDMQEFITHGLYVQKVMENFSAGYKPTEAEIKAQMEMVKAKHETATVKHVLIASKDEKGKARAEEVLKKALAGEDMAQLAKTYSEDPGSKDKGGEYTFPKGQMVPQFEEASFTGEIGKVYPKLVETDYGYHIIKVEKRDSGDPAQIKKESEESAKAQHAQDELVKLADALSVEKTDLYNTIGIIK